MRPLRAAAPVHPPTGSTPHRGLVAVCGLHGGAGATTLTVALATAAAAASTPSLALAVEADARAGELARRLGVASASTLAVLADLVAAARSLDAPAFVERPDGLRVLAAPEPAPLDARAGTDVTAVLIEARRAHGLVVVDSGPVPGVPVAMCLPAARRRRLDDRPRSGLRRDCAAQWAARSTRTSCPLGPGGARRPSAETVSGGGTR